MSGLSVIRKVWCLYGVQFLPLCALAGGQASTVTWPTSNAELALDLELHHQDRCGGFAPTCECFSGLIAETALRQVKQRFRSPACRFSLEESDCVTFVERCIAVGCAANWSEYYLILQRLRHRDGEIAFLSRNFFPLADWYQNNKWLFNDVTSDLGPTIEFEVVHRRKKFLSGLSFGEDDTPAGREKAALKAAAIASAPDKEVFRGRFLPRDEVVRARDSFQPGDVVLVIRTRSNPGQKPWYDCTHMGILGRDEVGRTILIHSAPPRVRAEPITFFLDIYPFVKGLVVLRLREGAPTVIQAELRRVSNSIEIPTPQSMDEMPPCPLNKK